MRTSRRLQLGRFGDEAVEEGDSTVLEERKRPCAARAEREQAGRPASQQGRESPVPEGTMTTPLGRMPIAAEERNTSPPPYR
jgi:hypothetical protein